MRSPSVALAVAGLAAVALPATSLAQVGRKTPPAAAAAVASRPGDWRTPDPDNLLVIDTNRGRIIVELAPAVAPLAVERLKTLARQHFYDGLSFFRVIDDFMDQTGDPKNNGQGGSSLPNLKGEFTFRRGPTPRFVPVGGPSAAPQGFIGSMPIQTQPDALMALTADGKVNAMGLFCAGVLGMARSGEPDSANSQFFLMRQAHPDLNGQYTPAGRVIADEDVVRAIKTGEPVPPPQDVMTRVRLASDLAPGERPDIKVLDTASPAFRAMAEQAGPDDADGGPACAVDIPFQGRIS